MPGKTKAVFLDRDGTLNVEKNYVYRIDDFEWLPGVPEALRWLQSLDYKIIVVSNQSGIARGYYSMKDVLALENHIRQDLARQGSRIDAFYYCPHHPEGVVEEYRKVCDCRKPAIGLFRQADETFHVDAIQSWMIGDAVADIGFGQNAGLKTILVKTGHGEKTQNAMNRSEWQPMFVADDLWQAVRDIIAKTPSSKLII